MARPKSLTDDRSPLTSSKSEAPRLRVLAGSAIAIGPGKADLLRAIDETGSISAAARRMRMSYRRAWLLVHTMNECFNAPLVEAAKGGTAGGGAMLTQTGRDVLETYLDLVAIAGRQLGPYLRAAQSRGKPARGQSSRRR